MPATKTQTLEELIEETILLFRKLRMVSAEIHGGGLPVAGQRGLLMDLANGGPQTVPTMARVRGVTRQNIQILIDRFRLDGLVELIDNPAHRRSKLIRLTPKGRKLVDEMSKRERKMLSSLRVKIPSSEVETAANVLRKFRQALQSVAATPEEK